MDLKVLSILLSVAAGLVVHPEPEMTQAFDKFISKHPSCMREILCFIDEVRYIIFHGEMIAGAPSYLQLKSPMSARKSPRYQRSYKYLGVAVQTGHVSSAKSSLFTEVDHIGETMGALKLWIRLR